MDADRRGNNELNKIECDRSFIIRAGRCTALDVASLTPPPPCV